MSDTGMAMTAAGGISGAYTKYESGQYNKRVADFNANYDRVLEQQALEAGGEQSNLREGKARVAEGATMASAGSQGVVAGAGTNRTTIASEEAASEMDKTMIAINARRKAYGFETSAVDQENKGAIDEAVGTQGAIGTLLNTGSQIYTGSHVVT